MRADDGAQKCGWRIYANNAKEGRKEGELEIAKDTELRRYELHAAPS